MANLWERFVDWAVRDAYTLEERELIRERARRLKLATDLQEERIRARQKRLEERRNDFRTVAVWKLDHLNGEDKVTSYFYLQQTRRMPDGSAYRKVTCGPMVHRDNGGVKFAKGELNAFFESKNTYLQFVLPWREWSISTPELKGATDIEVIKAEQTK